MEFKTIENLQYPTTETFIYFRIKPKYHKGLRYFLKFRKVKILFIGINKIHIQTKTKSFLDLYTDYHQLAFKKNNYFIVVTKKELLQLLKDF